MMRVLIPISALLLGMTAGGCKKPNPQPNTTTGSTAAAPAQTSADAIAPASPGTAQPDAPVVVGPPPPTTTVIPIKLSDPGNVDKTLADLTQALRKYGFERHQMPNSFSEVIAAGYVQPAPQPPPGKKFEIDARTKRVVLINQ